MHMCVMCLSHIMHMCIWWSYNTNVENRGRVAQWLMRCATNQKVAGSIPAGLIGIFH